MLVAEQCQTLFKKRKNVRFHFGSFYRLIKGQLLDKFSNILRSTNFKNRPNLLFLASKKAKLATLAACMQRCRNIGGVARSGLCSFISVESIELIKSCPVACPGDSSEIQVVLFLKSLIKTAKSLIAKLLNNFPSCQKPDRVSFHEYMSLGFVFLNCCFSHYLPS